MNFRVRQATRIDAHDLTPRLRESDVTEIRRASGMDAAAALDYSVEVSDPDMCWAATLDDRVEVLFGVNEIHPYRLGGIWMLGSDAIERHPRSFWVHCIRYLNIMHTRYPGLMNFVDVEHESANRWIRKLGFKPLQVVDLNGHLFIEYLSEANNV